MASRSDAPATPRYLHEIGASGLHAEGITGRGVGVVVLDTGVTEVPGLDTGQVGAGINLTGVGSIDDTTDWFGHGTHIAGLIAGDLSASPANPGFEGAVAPGAVVIPIKVAAPDGSTDVDRIVAGLQWAAANREKHNIRVLNLSFGTDGDLDWSIDPLNYAVQRCWSEGIAIIVAAGNRGPIPASITKPGDDPVVITVGMSVRGPEPGLQDDSVHHQSSIGPAGSLLKPDVVAPGDGLLSYLAPGSFVEQTILQDRPPADPSYTRATGSSFATGLVSGVAALLFEKRPDWSPDELKAALTTTAKQLGPSPTPYRQGNGCIDAVAASRVDIQTPPGDREELGERNLERLRGSRGHLRVATFDPDSGEVYGVACSDDDCGNDVPFDPATFLADGWETPEAWDRVWQAHKFHATAWPGHYWNHPGWNGAHWVGAHWVGAHWWGAHWWGAHWWGAHWV